MPSSSGQNELVQLQSELAAEIGRDAPHIATMVFGDNKNHPDMAQVSNAQLDDLYRSKYQSGDRQWLQAEARRDPQQFLDVAKRIGVQAPAPGSPPPPDPNALAKNMATALAPQIPAVPAAPVAPPAAPAMPVPQPALPVPPAALVAGPSGLPPAPPPVILGPNGMPLPPSGAM